MQPAAVQAVLRYLFARFDERFDGAPTLLILDEAWLFLDEPSFAARIRQWLKTLRKKNVSVVFATQSLADIKDSTIAPAIIESCASRIFLPPRRPNRRFARSTRASASTAGRSKSSPPRSQARLLPIAPRQSPVRPRPGAGRARLRRRIHTARPTRHRPRADAGRPASPVRGCAIAASIADLLPSSTAASFSLLNFRRFHHEDQAPFVAVSLAAVLSVSLLAVQPASALTVFDPSNFVQNASQLPEISP